MNRLTIYLLAASSLLFATVGCNRGPAMQHADGVVTFSDNGAPVPRGWVSFRCTTSERPTMARGLIQPDGSFSLSTFAPGDGAPIGDYEALVVVQLERTERDAKTPNTSPPLIDAKYSRFETSGLKFSVTDDPEKNHFKLSLDRYKPR